MVSAPVMVKTLAQRFNAVGQQGPVVLKGVKRGDLVKWVSCCPKTGIVKGAEVGVADGRFSLYLCEHLPKLKLLCVDPWLRYEDNPRGGGQAQQDGNYALALERLLPYNVTLSKQFSMDAVRDVPPASLDFVYLDGHHSFDWVMQDIIEWAKRVKPGGIVAGHDYYEFQWAGVIAAVKAYTAAHQIAPWFVTDEREPTFFWRHTPGLGSEDVRKA